MEKLHLNAEDEQSADFSSLSNFISWYFENKQPATYEKGIKHTEGERHRSFSDLYMLSTNYFPECTKKELAEIIISLWRKRSIYSLFCSYINKVVFCKRTNPNPANDFIHLITPTHFNPENPSVNEYSHNKPTKIGVDGYSFIEIYNLTI